MMNLEFHALRSIIGRSIIFALVSFASLCLSGCVSWLQPNVETNSRALKPGNYTLDKSHTTVLFKVEHMGLSTYVGRFNEVNAVLQYNPEDISASSLEAVVTMASVDVNNEKLERALRGSFWFDTEKYPQAFYKTVSARQLSEDKIVFEGELTLLGQTNPLEIEVTVNGGANNMLTGKYTLGFSASGALNRSEFGLDRFTPVVGDRVELEIHAEFQRNE